MLTLPTRQLITDWMRLDWKKLLRTAHPIDGVLRLERHHVYILPTRAGLFYAVLLVCMLIGSINYSLSLGFALTFLLAGLGIVAMLHTWRNLVGLQLQAGRTSPVFAGQPAQFHIALSDSRQRYAIAIANDTSPPIHTDVAAEARSMVEIALPTWQRGWRTLSRLTVSSEFPLGLFRAWSYVDLPARCLVYPQPAVAGMPWPESATGGSGRMHGASGDDEFSGLREHRSGDSLRRVDWKASARSQFLLSKQFEGSAGNTVWLDWQNTPGRDEEARIAQLTRWVLDAQAAGAPFGLRLPGQEIAPDAGDPHFQDCLQALALHGLPQ